MDGKSLKLVKSTVNKMVAMCDDRLSILKETDDYHDEDIRKDLDEQINHFVLLKNDAEQSLSILEKE